MKYQTEHSATLGFSRNYLSVFRNSRSIPVSVNADALLELYIEEKLYHDSIIDAFHRMYYALRDKRRIKAFAWHLYTLGIIGNANSFYSCISHAFSNVHGMRHRSYITKLLAIVRAYEEWK